MFSFWFLEWEKNGILLKGKVKINYIFYIASKVWMTYKCLWYKTSLERINFRVCFRVTKWWIEKKYENDDNPQIREKVIEWENVSIFLYAFQFA